MGNEPISNIDPDGGMCLDAQGNVIDCPDGYGNYDGPTIETMQFGDKTSFDSNTINALDPVVIAAKGLNLNKKGFSTNNSITIDAIAALTKGRPAMDDKIKAIILHRTVSGNYPGSWMKTKDKIPGAHFYIDKDGTTYQTASLKKSVAHIYSSSSKQMYKEYYKKLLNTNTVGIEVVGNYKNRKWEPLTQAQIDATSILVMQLKNHYNINNSKIYPHEKVQRKTSGEGQTVLDAINLNFH